MDVATAPRGELVRIIFKQRDTIAALESQIAELRSRLDTQGPNKQEKPPSWIKPNTKKKKYLSRKQREQGFARKLDTPTKQVFHTFNSCPDCGGELGKPSVSYSRQTIEIPPQEVEITEHVIFKRWCFTCKRRVAPKVNLKGVALGQQRIGIRLMSMIDMLKEACRQPVDTIQSYLEIMHNLHLSHGVLLNMLHKTADKGKPTYDSLKQHIREADVVYADETGGRENGKNGYFWSFNTDKVHFLIYGKSRSNSMVTKVLGDETEPDAFNGVLTSDFYTAYNIYNGFHQRCWVHLLRDIKDLKEDYPKDKQLKLWIRQVKTIYEEAKQYTGPPQLLPIGLKEEQRIAKQKYFEDKLREVAYPWIKTDAPQSVLSARVIKHLQELFVFVRFEGVSSDNNSAERILRHTVVARKISGGTRSPRGSETKSILASLFGTWKLQGLNPLDQCQLLLTSCQ